jgi:TRAP-type C4-dicarboxylate transport system permease small subunit
MIWIYAMGYVVSVVMGVFNLHKLWLLLTGQLSEAQMVQVVEAEGLKEAEASYSKT